MEYPLACMCAASEDGSDWDIVQHQLALKRATMFADQLGYAIVPAGKC